MTNEHFRFAPQVKGDPEQKEISILEIGLIALGAVVFIASGVYFYHIYFHAQSDQDQSGSCLSLCQFPRVHQFDSSHKDPVINIPPIHRRVAITIPSRFAS